MVLSDKKGQRLALVTVDLGNVSALMHRLVADLVHAETGLTADRILISATHTHSGPAGFSGNRFYNVFGSKGLFTGFDSRLTSFLCSRIAESIIKADQDREKSVDPIRVAFGEREIPCLTRNRSREAWQANAQKLTKGVEPKVSVLRIDRINAGAANGIKSLGAYVVYSGHPTVIGTDNDLWHADVFGVAVQQMRRLSQRSQDSAVFLLANGAEGDVSFAWRVQRHDEALKLGNELATATVELFENLAQRSPASTTQLSLAHAFEIVNLPNAETGLGKQLCRRATFGIPTLGGAEDGRSDLFGLGLFGHTIEEGVRFSKPRGCQGHKVPALGALQSLLVAAEDFPQTAPLQIFKIGPVAILAAPFELTTESGARLKQIVLRRLQGRAGIDHVVAVSMANGYLAYVATPEEYSIQHYEGSSTVYGPESLPFLQQQFEWLTDRVVSVVATSRHLNQAPLAREFSPGPDRPRLSEPADSDAPISRRLGPTVVAQGIMQVVWQDVDLGRLAIADDWLVGIEQANPGGAAPFLLTVDGQVANDRGLDFELRCLCSTDLDSLWRARWFVPASVSPNKDLRVRIKGRAGRPDLIGEWFRIAP